MPTKSVSWFRALNKHIERRTTHRWRQISPRHLGEIKRVCREAGKALESAGLVCAPSKFGDSQLDYLVTYWSKLKDGSEASGRQQTYNWCLLNGFLKSYGNSTVERAGLWFPKEEKRNCDYLHGSEPDRLLEASCDLGVYAHFIVAVELTMGLRRSEVLRLRLEDVFDEIERGPLNPAAEDVLRCPVRVEFRVRGKAKYKPKVRWVPVSDHVRAMLPDLIRERARQVEGNSGCGTRYVLAHVADRPVRDNLGNEIPEGWVAPWCKAYSDNEWMRPAFPAAGINRPGNLHHALRRTYGRALWDAHKTLEEIAVLMGHESSLTTLRHYLRLDVDDRVNSAAPINARFPPAYPRAEVA